MNDADGDVGAPWLLVRIRMELANLPCALTLTLLWKIATWNEG